MKVIWQSKHFEPESVVSTYAMLYSNGEVKFFDVDKRHKTIRESWDVRESLAPERAAKLVVNNQVLIAGLTMQERIRA